jgi:hypothetical protein
MKSTLAVMWVVNNIVNFVKWIFATAKAISVFTRTMTSATASVEAQTLAMAQLRSVLMTMGVLTVITMVLAMSGAMDTATDSANELDKSLIKLAKPKTDAQRQLEKYLELQKEVVDKQNLINKLSYDKKTGNTLGIISDLFKLSFNDNVNSARGSIQERASKSGIPYEALTNDSAGQRYLDSLKSLMPSSSADSIVSNSPRDINYFSRTQSIERKDVKVTIENNSGNNVSVVVAVYVPAV